MKTLGIFQDNLCTLIESARIVVLTKVNPSDLQDLIEYGELPVFESYEQVEIAAFGE